MTAKDLNGLGQTGESTAKGEAGKQREFCSRIKAPKQSFRDRLDRDVLPSPGSLFEMSITLNPIRKLTRASLRHLCLLGFWGFLTLTGLTVCLEYLSRAADSRPSVSGSSSRIASGEEPQRLAARPPLGWNSWDGYGTTVNESQVKANAQWFAKHLKPFGWQYIVVDMEWFVINPIAEGNSKSAQYSLDAFGRYTPPASRFPSAKNGQGFKPLADFIHSLGLKFGIHILRGIPKKAVVANLPVAGSSYRAADAADTSETCPWNPDNYGIGAERPGAQAYYDSIAQLYASWGVDLIKVDCISSRPYRGDEIRMLSTALRKTGRPMVLSLSPGPAPIEKAGEMSQYAQMWRISNDVWDLWHSTVEYPQGLADQFANAALWAGVGRPGHWPDADMLPLGYLGPAPGWGKPRQSQLTHDEQRTLVTLWSIFSSPLMIGGDLTRADPWTVSLLTNPEVLEVDQRSAENRVAFTSGNVVIWTAKSSASDALYLAVFNLGAQPATLRRGWEELGFNSGEYIVRDLWLHRNLGDARAMDAAIAPHASALYQLRAVAKSKGRH
jgi:alpha-galactosidase